MSSVTAPSVVSPAAPTSADATRRAWLLISFAILLAAAAQWDYRMAQREGASQTLCLITGIVTLLCSAGCFSGAFLLLDRALAAGIPARLHPLFAAQKRLLMLAQILTIAFTVIAAGFLLFHESLPTPDRSPLDRDWTPPADNMEH